MCKLACSVEILGEVPDLRYVILSYRDVFWDQ